MPPNRPSPQFVRQVIDRAIAENTHRDRFCFGIAVFAFVTGAAAIAVGLYNQSGAACVSGAAFGQLLWPALKWSRDIQLANQAIRLMEIPLRNAATAAAAAEAIHAGFAANFHGRK